MKGLLSRLSASRRLRERAWREIRGPRRAFSLGGLVGTGGNCGCCTADCPVTICAKNLCAAGIAGASVQVKEGSTVRAGGTTDATGCVTLDIGTAGTYTLVIAAAGYNTQTTSNSFSCGGTIDKTLSVNTPGGYDLCCSMCPRILPTTWHVTDANGTWTATHSGLGAWATPAAGTGAPVAPSVSPVCRDAPGNPTCGAGTSDMNYQYLITCGTSAGQISVRRIYPYVDCTGYGIFTPPRFQYQGNVAQCGDGGLLGGESRGTGTIDCDSLTASVSLSPFGSPDIADPVSGGCAISP